MIARCNFCDKGREYFTGYRYDPRRAALRYYHCGYCAGPLRPKRKGETEANTVDAGWGPPKRVRMVKP